MRGIQQRWPAVESAVCKGPDNKQLEEKNATTGIRAIRLRQLCHKEFVCEADAVNAANRLSANYGPPINSLT